MASSTEINPYEADPEKIPTTDRYVAEPLYGRCLPRTNDFKPDLRHVNSRSPKSLQYWAFVLEQCNASNRIYENIDGGRDVFALGGVIIKSSHLRERLEGRRACRNYSFADKNELQATAIAKRSLTSVKLRVPEIYFADKINDRDVLVQERIPGVGLNITWQYLSQDQKVAFKEQARGILNQLRKIKPPNALNHAAYLEPDPDPVYHRGIQDVEADILFSSENADSHLCFMHNDFSMSNTIVDQDKIAGLVDWEMAGYFSYKTAAEVHVKIRSPKRENYAALNLPEDFLEDLMFWSNIYA
ncbi:hypothetical protein K402DRAFT_339375 [Aulographum hederae CBS 113979]|uniref:Aminoglycoside phosphotransferase domain-containing protein n=1 Tax=Aulographum hederae CBS 113979 TaxID=1176131 RepID=A0A6G1GPN3_9PEZI|nr:hypothetical protein K402DRAFT_339375 [Aulographum hederae CBS 113979]